MNVARFASYLLKVALLLALAAGAVYADHQLRPPHRTAEANAMRANIARGAGSHYERAKLDALYERGRETPPLVMWLLSAAGVTLVLGAGLRQATQP